MPGITLIHQEEKLEPDFLENVLSSILSMRDVSVLVKENAYILIKKGKPNYPVQVFQLSEFTVVVEGRIYSVAVGEDDFFNKNLKELFNKNRKSDAIKYLRGLDGEFIIYVIEKATKSLVVVNDFIGRLPAYYYISGNQFILSRDIGIIKLLKRELTFDRQGVYEYMRLGYPLGNKTLFKNMHRLPPSTCIDISERISLKSESISLRDWALEGIPSQDGIELLHEFFTEAVRNRLKAAKRPVLSLSGGLDSRILMGEIEKKKQTVAYESFIYKNPIIESDAAVVKMLTDHFGKKATLTALKEWSPDYFNELISMKYGMNYLGMAFLIPFLLKMGEKYDMMLTGDGGDKTLAYLFPGRNLLYNNPVKNILQKNEIGSSAACKILFGFDTENMENEMIGKLRSYGYSDARWNYKHFLIYERTKNWLFEGEDRNRSYIWSTSPFYHPDFFKTVHSIDEKEKKDFKLYQAFLNKIAPELNDIINANWGFAINETKRLRSFLLKQTLKQEVKRILPIIKIRTLATQEILSEVNRLIRQQHTEQALFNNKFEIKSLSQEELFHFLTLLKVSEAMEA